MLYNNIVSIITPNYNCEKYISETIESVKKQTYKNWEMIIVDDCSTDLSYDIALKYSENDSRIKVFRNETNKGAAFTRNKALQIASGRFIAFLDSDDLWNSEKLEKQLLFMQKNNYSFSYTKFNKINTKGESLSITVSGPKCVSRKMLLRSNYFGCLTVMYDSDVVGKLQISNDILKRNDYALWLKALKMTKSYLLEESLASYRIGSVGSLSSSGVKSLIKYHYKLYRKSENFGVIKSIYFVIANLFYGVIRKRIYTKKV